MGNKKFVDFNINVRSVSNVISVGIDNVMRNINWVDKRFRIKCLSIGILII